MQWNSWRSQRKDIPKGSLSVLKPLCSLCFGHLSKWNAQLPLGLLFSLEPVLIKVSWIQSITEGSLKLGFLSTQCPSSALLFFWYPEGAEIVFPESNPGFSSPPESQVHFAVQPDSKRSFSHSFFAKERFPSLFPPVLFSVSSCCLLSSLLPLWAEIAVCAHCSSGHRAFYFNHISKGCYVLEIYSLNHWGREPRKYLCLSSKLCLLHLANCFTSH